MEKIKVNTMSKYFQVKNWEKHQHYKDRAPPWIKLYNDLLDDFEFSCLQDASKAHLIGIWLLASRTNNKIPMNATWVGNKIGATELVDFAPLVEAGFIEGIIEKPVINQPLPIVRQDAIAPLAKRLPREREEREEETERERENKKPSAEQSSTGVSEVFEFWQTLLNHPRSKLDPKRAKLIKAALKLGYTVEDLKSAISGCSKTPHNMGKNDNGQKYDDISLILRDAGQIDRFIGNDEQAPVQQQAQPMGRMDQIRARRDASRLNVINQSEVIGHE